MFPKKDFLKKMEAIISPSLHDTDILTILSEIDIAKICYTAREVFICFFIRSHTSLFINFTVAKVATYFVGSESRQLLELIRKSMEKFENVKTPWRRSAQKI